MSHDLGMGEDFVNCGCREAFVRLLTNTDDSNSPSTNASRYGLHYQFDVLPVSKADWYFLSLFLLTEIILPISPNFRQGNMGKKDPQPILSKMCLFPYIYCIPIVLTHQNISFCFRVTARRVKYFRCSLIFFANRKKSWVTYCALNFERWSPFFMKIFTQPQSGTLSVVNSPCATWQLPDQKQLL